MKLNNKGFAVSSILYSLMVLFVFLIFTVIMLFANSKVMFDKMKTDMKADLEGVDKVLIAPNSEYQLANFQEDKNIIENYFTYSVIGKSPIASMKCIDKNHNTEVSNVNELSIGSHEIECTITKTNNYSKSATTNIAISSDYVCSSVIVGTTGNIAYGTYKIGDEYECNPGDGKGRRFYVISSTSTTVKLIMDRNLGNNVSWNGTGGSTINEASAQLQSMTSSWKDVTVSLPVKNDIYGITNSLSINKDTYPYLLTNINCNNNKCSENATQGINNGYWTATYEGSGAYVVNEGALKTITTSNLDYGVRPVITVNKSDIYDSFNGLTDISIVVSPAGWANKKTVTITYPANMNDLEYEYSTDGVRWTKVADRQQILTFTSDGYVIARMVSGSSYIKSKTMNVTQIDTYEPEIKVIKNNTIELTSKNEAIFENYFSVTNRGASPIASTICIDTSNGNEAVSNIRDLRAGVHNLSCTVTKANGLTASANITITTFDKRNVFTLNSGYHTYKVPIDGYYKFEAWGAQGSTAPGKGAYTSGSIYLTKGTEIYVYVGGRGSTACETNAGGGYNGGGSAGPTGCSYSGGGATDFRVTAGAWNDAASLRSRIMVAAGGGAGEDGNGGAGGELNGTTNHAGSYATQTSGSGFGYAPTPSGDASGAGGGYYAGILPTADTVHAGGGSSFISGHLGCNAVNSSGAHTGSANHYSGKVFVYSQMLAGNTVMPNYDHTGYMTGNDGDGYAVITYEGATPYSDGEELIFTYSGTYKKFTAQKAGYYKFEAWGASGGSGYGYDVNEEGGKGAYTKGTIYLNKDQTIYVYVGGRGSNNTCQTCTAPGGFNGGGMGNRTTDNDESAGGGGGATDFRLSSGSWNDITGLRSRIMVAAGGGGGHNTSTYGFKEAMAGGKLSVTGQIATWLGAWSPNVTQTSGGAFGYGTDGIESVHGAGGGGGGYYGGYTYNINSYSGRAPGGSSFISGYEGCNAVNSSGTHTGSPIHYSNLKFLNGVMAGGNDLMPNHNGSAYITGNEGNGLAKIKYMGQNPYENGEEMVYTSVGNKQTFTALVTGEYQFEAWGASGGLWKTSNNPGKGAYTKGSITLQAGQTIDVNVGCSNCGFGGGAVGGNIDDSYSGGGATDYRVKTTTQKYRYVRDWLSGSTANTASHWVEVDVFDIYGNKISYGKTVTGTGTASPRPFQNATDGNIFYDNYTGIDGGGTHYIEIDLGAEYEIGYVHVWHYYADSRTYYGTKTELISADRTVTNVINDAATEGTYIETVAGKKFYAYDNASLRNRIMVAAGGGGTGELVEGTYPDGAPGGEGGTLYGVAGYVSYSGAGATQTAGGAGSSNAEMSGKNGRFGVGGSGGLETCCARGGGGGGGYYGGGGGAGVGGADGAGGSGSSFISGFTGCNAVDANGTHTGSSEHFSGLIFKSAQMISGKGSMPNVFGTNVIGNSGHGYAKITFGTPASTSLVSDFSYTGGVQTFVAPKSGIYQLETWGAQGGSGQAGNIGGYGGYSTGTINLAAGQTIYVYVGGKGQTVTTPNTTINGGYNGGGNAKAADSDGSNAMGSGGGATHISTSSGLLTAFSSNQTPLLIVAGGGGGSSYYRNTDAHYHYGSGGAGGGYIGASASNHYSSTVTMKVAAGGAQAASGTASDSLYFVGSFGQGRGVTTYGSGGGGGFFGGDFMTGQGAGGGSGYIQNASLTNKMMYCYGCSESSSTNTYTVNTIGSSSLRDTAKCSIGYSEDAVSKCAKSGNGHARITYVSELQYVSSGNILNLDGENPGTMSNSWEDRSGKENNVTLFNFAGTPTSGFASKGLKFDGTNDYIKRGTINGATQNGSYTVEFVATFDELEYLEMSFGPIQFKWRVSGQIEYWNTYNSAATYIQSYNAYSSQGSINTKTHYAITFDNSSKELKAYKNGTLYATYTSSIVPNTLMLQTNDTAETEAFDGTLHALRMYNRPLTANEISTNYKIDKIKYGF